MDLSAGPNDRQQTRTIWALDGQLTAIGLPQRQGWRSDEEVKLFQPARTSIRDGLTTVEDELG